MKKKTRNILEGIVGIVAIVVMVVGIIFFFFVDYKSGEYKLDESTPVEQCATLYIQHLKPLNIDGKAIAGSKIKNIFINLRDGGAFSGLTGEDVSINKYYKIIIPEGKHKLELGTGYSTLDFDIDLEAGKKYIATEIEIKKDLKEKAKELVSGSTKHSYRILPYTKDNAEKYGVSKYWKE